MNQAKRKSPIHLAVSEVGNRSVIIFLTVCTKDRACLLDNPESHALLCACWDTATHWRVGKYIIMPDHIHLFCSPSTIPPASLKLWVGYWKREYSLSRKKDDKMKVWQKNYWDRQLRSGESYTEKWNYVEQNPVRAGLVKDFKEWEYKGEMHLLMWHD